MMNRIIDVVLMSMEGELTFNQRERLEQVLIKIMSRYEIIPAKQEIQKVGDFYMEYLREFVIYERTKGLSELSIRQYVDTVDKMFKYINKSIEDIRDVDIRLFLSSYEQYRGVSKCRLNNMRRNISAFFNYARDMHYIDVNPCDTIRAIKSPKKIKKAYSKHEITKLSNSTKCIRDRAIVALLKSSGIRVSELVALNISDINFQNKTFYVLGKGGKEREVCFNDEAAELIREYLCTRTDNEPALFVHKNDNGRLEKGGVESMLRKLGKNNGIHAYPHRFRRTFITNAIDQKMPLPLVSKLAGHTDINTTMIYCDLDEKKMKKAYRKIKL